MNVKVDRLISDFGFCCKWAFFFTYKDVGSSKLKELLDEDDEITLRALQKQRERYRNGEFKCTKCDKCIKGSLK